ncbi:MAG: hypothetical protein HDR02_10390 [Lachnospiraceae bacterium]|nr:hypothetical protein [Lachnospiraceae bacterium]
MQDFKMPFSEKTASIGISFDVPNKKETIIIGSPEDVKRYYTSGILSESADLRTRKLGTLVDEMNELAQAADGDKMTSVIAASNGLCSVLNSGQGNKAASEYTDTLCNLYDTSANANMLFNYIIFFVMTNFNLNHKSLSGEFHLSVKQMKKSAERFAEQYNACISDMLLPFRNLPTVPEENVRYWNIDKQINLEKNDLILQVYSSHSSGTWQTGYAADNSFMAILRVYVDVLNQANVVVRNCKICHKLILSDRANVSEICGSEKCRKEQHRLATNAVRKKNKDNPIQDLYDIFSRNCSNLRRKLGKNSTAREKFDIEFAKIRSQALKMKKGLSEDSPKQSIYEYSEFLRTKENELRELAENLLLHFVG